MTISPALQPTLWRTCRVLANRQRLEMFRRLLQEPDQTVSAVAKGLDLSLPLASLALRAMEARGLLTVRRVGRWVKYECRRVQAGEPSATLVAALRQTFQRQSQPIEAIFKLATAFTHPRRIEVFRALQKGPRSMVEIQMMTRISVPALVRHLRKLTDRGLVAGELGRYQIVDRPDALGRELARLAMQ